MQKGTASSIFAGLLQTKISYERSVTYSALFPSKLETRLVCHLL